MKKLKRRWPIWKWKAEQWFISVVRLLPLRDRLDRRLETRWKELAELVKLEELAVKIVEL